MKNTITILQKLANDLEEASKTPDLFEELSKIQEIQRKSFNQK